MAMLPRLFPVILRTHCERELARFCLDEVAGAHAVVTKSTFQRILVTSFICRKHKARNFSTYCIDDNTICFSIEHVHDDYFISYVFHCTQNKGSVLDLGSVGETVERKKFQLAVNEVVDFLVC